jgi:heme A synthase
MVIEWSHRWLAATVGLLAVLTLVLVVRDRAGRRVVAPAAAAVWVIGVQALVGRLVVQRSLDADLVSLHLAISMAALALLTVTAVDAGRWDGARSSDRGPERSWTAQLAIGAGVVGVVLLLGSSVHDAYVSGWPLVGGELVPDMGNGLIARHFAHRAVAGFGALYLFYLAVAASRHRARAARAFVLFASCCYLLNAVLGAVHVVTRVESGFVIAAHLTLAAAAWAMLVAATAASIASNSDRVHAVHPPSPANARSR